MAIHISFFYIEERLKYLNKIIDASNAYERTADLFIHTNEDFPAERRKEYYRRAGMRAYRRVGGKLNEYTNGKIEVVVHDLSKTHPFYLTWQCRDLMKSQKDDYDIFMYLEDDILVPEQAIKYWLEHNEKLIRAGYNLGFVRIEKDIDNKEYSTDIFRKLTGKIELPSWGSAVDDCTYRINDCNPYCAMWIYNKNEFNKFVNSKFWDIANIPWPSGGKAIRERSAVGLHWPVRPSVTEDYWYKETLIPSVDDKLTDDCKIFHLPNNYIKFTWKQLESQFNSNFGTIRFKKLI